MRTIQRTVFGMLVLFLFITPASFAQRGGGPGGGGPMQPSSTVCDTQVDSFNSGQVDTISESCITNQTVAGSELNHFISSGRSQITFCPPGWNSLSHSIVSQICSSSNCVTGGSGSQGSSSTTATSGGSYSTDSMLPHYAKSVHSYEVHPTNAIPPVNVSTQTASVGGGQ